MATLLGRQSSGSQCTSLCGPPPLKKSCRVKRSPQIIYDPDPSIYTQQQIAGSLPSYDNPHIDSVNLWPISVPDRINARVRNLSADASANQTRIDVLLSQWGIGMPQQSGGTAIVDLARAGLGGSQKQVSVPLRQGAKDAGCFGRFVRIYHPYDRDSFNNFGEEAVRAPHPVGLPIALSPKILSGHRGVERAAIRLSDGLQSLVPAPIRSESGPP